MLNPLTKLINELAKLPGIGKKTAERLSFYILNMDEAEATTLSQAIIEMKRNVKPCSVCNNITEGEEICEICKDTRRNKNLVCVVESLLDLVAIEKNKEYKGVFHVLMGTISPLAVVETKPLKIENLLSRIKEGLIKEIIIATNPNTKGEITAMYLKKLIKPYGIKITQLARGLPIGGEIEYTDAVTLAKAIEGRIEI